MEMEVVSHFENRAALRTVGITPRKVLPVILRVPRVESRSSSTIRGGCANRVDEPAVAGFERRAKKVRKRGVILREARVEFVFFFDLPKTLCPILLDNFRQFPPKAKKITNSWDDRLRNTFGSLAEHSDGTRKEKPWPHQWRIDRSTAGARRYDRRRTDRHRVPRLQRPPLAGSLPIVRREDARRRYRRRDECDRRLDTRRARNVLPHSPYRKRLRRLGGLDGCEPLSRHALRPRAQDVSGFGRGE